MNCYGDTRPLYLGCLARVGYDQALQALQDLAEAMKLAGREFEFQHGLVKLLAVHGNRAAWMKGLAEAGFSVGDI